MQKGEEILHQTSVFVFFKAYEQLRGPMKNESEQGGPQETGRWQGYKESQDSEAGHWGSSHVSYLTFRSLVQLRRTMDTGEGKKSIIMQHSQK